MKFLEKVGLALFSNVVLILSIIVVFVLFNWLDAQIIANALNLVKDGNEILKYTILALSVVFIILAIRCIFFTGANSSDNKKDGVTVESANGKLLITKETLENIVSSVVKGFEGAKETVTKIAIDMDNGVFVFVTLNVLPDVVIKDLINNIQEQVKDAIKKASDLDVKEVNIKVKSIYERVEKKLEE